ncbi:unnamed protein product, partial [Heterosigma akashiwo]
ARLPGVHDHAGGRLDLQRGHADRRGGVPHPQEGHQGEVRAGRHQRRRRGGLRPQHPEQPRGGGAADGGAGALRPRG